MIYFSRTYKRPRHNPRHVLGDRVQIGVQIKLADGVFVTTLMPMGWVTQGKTVDRAIESAIAIINLRVRDHIKTGDIATLEAAIGARVPTGATSMAFDLVFLMAPDVPPRDSQSIDVDLCVVSEENRCQSGNRGLSNTSGSFFKPGSLPTTSPS